MTNSGQSNKPKILVVDDDAAIGLLLSLTLEREGYDPVVFNESEKALIFSRSADFSLAFININLQDESGLDLAVRLKQDDPTREVVFITGSGSLDNAVKAIKIGAYDYLKKPILLDEFKLCLKRFQEKQALREQIRRVEQRHFQLVQNIPLLIYILDRDLELVFVNAACSGMLGFSPAEAMNTRNWFMERIHADDRYRLRRLFSVAFKTGSPVSIESKFLHKDGHYIHALLKSIPPTSYGVGIEREHLEGFAVDITDRVFLEKSLVHREKLKTLGAVSAEVAHEIRNPLMSIGGFAKRLKQRFPDMHECDIILNESQRLEKILSRIRNYLEPVEIHPKECSIHAIIEDCLNLLSPEMEKKRVVCNITLNAELPTVYADPEVLTQIFINLIRNAVNAVSNGGTLAVKSYETDQDIRMTFSNRADGLRFTHPETLFMPFADGGQSFGLPLCYRLIRDMGGLLSFSQDKEYVTFSVVFPKKTSFLESLDEIGMHQDQDSDRDYPSQDPDHAV